MVKVYGEILCKRVEHVGSISRQALRKASSMNETQAIQDHQSIILRFLSLSVQAGLAEETSCMDAIRTFNVTDRRPRLFVRPRDN
jgi:hypothetical protein